MTGEDRETGLRCRLDAYVERQHKRVAEIERLATAGLQTARSTVDRGAPRPAEPRGADVLPATTRTPGAALPAVTVVIPVQDDADALLECLTALAEHTSFPASLLLIDDASTDPGVERLLESVATLDGVLVLRNATRAGVGGCVARALRACDGDVVVVEAPAVVGPRWLERLVRAAYAKGSADPENSIDEDISYRYIKRSSTSAPIRERRGSGRQRLLFVVHEGGGGAVAGTRDLIAALAEQFECYCFSSDREVLRLRSFDGRAEELLEEWPLQSGLALGDLSRPEYRRAFTAALGRCSPRLVHIGHMFKHTFDAPSLAAANAVPVVMSFHDHYFICPTIHLLDERGRYCAGQCTPGPGICPTGRGASLPVLKHGFVYEWREEVEAALRHVDAFVTCSEYTRDIHRRLLSVTRERPFELIEHGRDLPQHGGFAAAPEPGGRVRILVPAHLDRHKGAGLLAAMLELDRGRRLDLHFLGDVSKHYLQLGVIHGPYERDQFADRVREIAPAFIGVFSTTGESYSFAITEAWAAGVPVLATDIGAQADRVRSHGGGFVISHDDPAAALAQVLHAADDPVGYAHEAARADATDLPGVGDMAARYADLYRRVLDGRRTLAALESVPAMG
jgi:glycosyltransferase involved in cell wall biosynthesis